MTIASDQLAAALKPARKPSKFKNVRTQIDGLWFDSAGEARRWSSLRLLERAGKIRNLQRQVIFDLCVNGMRVCRYRADFTYVDHDRLVVEDFKGFRTPEFKIKAALMKAVHDIEVKLT